MDNPELRVSLLLGKRFETDPDLVNFFEQVALDALLHRQSQDLEEVTTPSLQPNRIVVSPDSGEGQIFRFVVDSYVDFESGSLHAGHHEVVLRQEDRPYATIFFLTDTESGENVGDGLGIKSPELVSLVRLVHTDQYEQQHLPAISTS